MAQEMKLPTIGEQTATAVVLSVLVEPGSEVGEGDAVLELESDKATTEVPASAAGVVEKVLVSAGDEVSSGQAILTLADASEEEASEEEAPEEEAPEEEAPEEEAPEEEAPEDAESPDDEDEAEASETDDPETETGEDPSAAPSATSRTKAPRATDRAGRSGRRTPRPSAPTAVPAPPNVRQLARELGVSLDDVAGTDPRGRITTEDVKAHVRARLQDRPDARDEPAPSMPDFSAFGEVTRVPMTRLRRAIADNVTASLQIPQVTQFDRADITDLQRVLTEAGEQAPTLTAIVIAIVARVLHRFPDFNASLDPAAAEIVRKAYVHIGVAVDTEEGLLVPVLRDADTKTAPEIAQALSTLADAARARRLSPEQMQGASFSVTNLGGLGTTRFTPLLTPHLVAILGMGRAEEVAVFEDGRAVPRQRLPLCVTYDHRVVDGADAARFLRAVAELLEQPLRLLWH